MKFKPVISTPQTLTTELIAAHIDENNVFDWKAAGIGGDFILGLCSTYFPIHGQYKISSHDDLQTFNEMMETIKTCRTPEPRCIISRGTKVDIFTFSEAVFAMAMIKHR